MYTHLVKVLVVETRVNSEVRQVKRHEGTFHCRKLSFSLRLKYNHQHYFYWSSGGWSCEAAPDRCSSVYACRACKTPVGCKENLCL